MADAPEEPKKRPNPDPPGADPPKRRNVASTPASTHASEDRGKPSSGFLAQATAGMSGPHPTQPTITMIVLYACLDAFFGAVHTAIINLLYPDGRFNVNGVITRENFVLVCRYLLCARLHCVYSALTGRRKDGRIAIPHAFKVPAAIAAVINCFGGIAIQNKGIMVVPEPEDQPADQAERLQNRVTFATLQSFEKLVKAAEHRGYISLESISTVPDGTAAWLLTPRDADDAATIATGTTDRIRVQAVFSEFTPADALLCAIMQRGFDGLIPDVLPHLLWEFDPITGLGSLRIAFCTSSP